MEKRKILFTGAIVCAFLTALLAGSFSAEAENCQSKLVGKSFNCSAFDQAGGEQTFTFEFETGGLSQNFDLFINSAEYGCSCNATGSVQSPKFNASSNAFECLSTITSYLINGKLNGKKIKGQGTSEAGDGIIITCKQQP